METAEYPNKLRLLRSGSLQPRTGIAAFLKARLLTEGVDYPRTHRVRTLLEIISDVIPDNKNLL